jgi:hypothetical protein
MVGIVASWRCKCGIRVKVLAEVDPSQPPARQIASCPNCGESRNVQADEIISVTEDISDASPAFESKHDSESSLLRCNEKERLFAARNKAFDIYSRLSTELAEAAGRIAHAEFEFLANRARDAREAFLETGKQLSDHMTKHGC